MAAPQKTIHPRCEELVWNCQPGSSRARMWHFTEHLRVSDTGYQPSRNLSHTHLMPTQIRNSRKIIAIIDTNLWFVSDNFVDGLTFTASQYSWPLRLCLIAGCDLDRRYPELSHQDRELAPVLALWGPELAQGSPWVLLPVIPLYLPAGSLSDCSQSSFSTLQYLALVIKLLG